LLQSKNAFGQVDEGSITGTVQDTSGAVVAKAHVVLLNTDQGLALETDTSPSGSYTFSPIRIGHYSVTVTAPGFSKTAQQNITVQVAQNLQVNIQLKPGAATETVEVTDAPPVLQTEDASVGQVVDTKSVNNLPLNGRNFTFLAQIGAGVNTPQSDGRGNAQSGAFSANGLRPAQNNYLLDGIDNNSNAVDFLNGTNYIVVPPVDAIAEFKVQTADFTAQYGRSGGAVLNATIKSGTNSIHGTVYEFLRNDVFDAADFFEPEKLKLRQNQFGFSGGGPIIKNKLFIFGDYEGFRKVQGQVQVGSVPTATERSTASNYTDLSDIIRFQSGVRQDDLGRNIPYGTVTDPATTRLVKANAVDPISGFTNLRNQDTYVRDPISAKCPANTQTYSLAACSDLNNLNVLGDGRVDPRAQALLALYPAPNNGTNSITNNFKNGTPITEHRNQFDVRGDFNPSQSDQMFVRFSYTDDPIFFPGIFGGVADGGFFGQGPQTVKSSQTVGAWTHIFTPSTTNQARVGFNHLHTTRFGPLANVDGIPDQFGIKGIQQGSENGGLPTIGIGGLNQIGSSNFLPSDEVSQTLQITDDFTKIYGNHSFKTGIEYQHVKFSTLQPGWSRGQFAYDGNYVDVPTLGNSNTGIAQFLIPAKASNVGGVDYTGGPDNVFASNINKTYDERNYFAAYFQDDWKVTPKLTLNLGLRYDYFGPIGESNGAQANFIPEKTGPFSGPTMLIPKSGKANRHVSTKSSTTDAAHPDGISTNYTDFLASLNINILSTDDYGKGLVRTQKTNFAPRVGFAYQMFPRFVMRGGLGLAYNAFENQGYGPNIGENYPFVFNLNYTPSGAGGGNVQPVSANTPFANCNTAGPGGTADLYSAFTCIPLDPAKLDAQGLGLLGAQFDAKTPRTLSVNYTLQYSLTHTLAIQTAYVLTHVDNLQIILNTNNVNQLLGANEDTTFAKPFPKLGNGNWTRTIGYSTYNGLQTTLQQQAWHGLNYLITYTWSKSLTNASDQLNGGGLSGYRAPSVKGLGIDFDKTLAPSDIRNVFHFSGGYELPFGTGKAFLGQSGRLGDLIIGGWSLNFNAAVQGGQPQTIGCGYGGTTDLGCYALRVAGQSQKRGEKIVAQEGGSSKIFWYNNRLAFNQPCKLDSTLTPVPDSPNVGCLPLTGFGALGGTPSTVEGPDYKKVDLSLFKNFKISERFRTEFRAEFFNVFNHPNFSAPSNTNISDENNFGQVTSTRDNPYGARQLQLALKLYY